jgi:succinate dehydrogenase / fumarate reductase, cytochrome b subunit
MTAPRPRPLSPHLTVYKWEPHMAVSIAHRVMGVALATVGVAMFVWWLAALASGKADYATFLSWAQWPGALIVPVGLSFAFFLHMANGIRHFVMDIGAGYALKTSRTGALAVFAFAAMATAGMWLYIFGKAL